MEQVGPAGSMHRISDKLFDMRKDSSLYCPNVLFSTKCFSFVSSIAAREAWYNLISGKYISESDARSFYQHRVPNLDQPQIPIENSFQTKKTPCISLEMNPITFYS
ncbi:hypothetical protein MHB50_14720 [Siminovitchia sp. FSL H7-0308]|uniref:hypothetical protein n=1 Tax=Siminovitchia sp. FSL H7-0308 TaxID=2921432 RepID=UPI0030EC7A6D